MKAILVLFSLYLFACVRTTPIADAPHSPGIVSPDTIFVYRTDTVFVKGPVRIVYRDVEKVDAWGWSQPINIGDGIYGTNPNLITTISDSAFWKMQRATFSDSIFIESVKSIQIDSTR